MRKTIQLTTLIFILLSMGNTKAFAYDFAAKNTDGTTIYYNYTNNGKELEVTYLHYNIMDDYNKDAYSNNVVIPKEVTYMNVLRKVTRIGDYAFSYCSGLTSVTIPNSVTSIDNHAFYCCSGLTSVIIPNNITSIGDYAFKECSNLTVLTIPNSVTNIGKYAFDGCTNLSSVSIPNSVTTIGVFAFSRCSSLTSVIIPNSITSISNSTFSNCTSLTSVTIPNSVINIGDAAFFGCSSLTAVTIPNSITTIGTNAFAYCSLTSMTIPEGMTDIGGGAFWACGNLTSVTIPNSVTTIGNLAFYGCPNLISIISQIKIPFEIPGRHSSTQVFDYRLYEKATLYVPFGTIDKYKVTNGWKDFRFIEEMETTHLTQMKTTPVRIQMENGEIRVSGAEDGKRIAVFDANGMEIGTAISQGGQVNIPSPLPQGSIAIVKIGERSVKLAVK